MAGTERKAGRSPPNVLPTVYNRRLPHIQPKSCPLFVTWALAGVNPICKRAIGWNSEGAIFAQRDRELDTLESGPRWLADPRVGEIVRDFIFFGEDKGEFELGPWVVMPNHVHMIITPHRPLWAVMRDIKSGSARHANQILNRQGERFWQREYYDRVVRNEQEEGRISDYIEHNPVRAGLCGSPELWEFSSAHESFVHRAWPGTTSSNLVFVEGRRRA